MKVTAFNDGKVGVETLKLTREIGDITEKLSADDKNLIMELLCVYADTNGSFSNDPLVNRSFNGQLSLLNVVVASLRNMKDDLVEYKKEFINVLPCFAFDYGDIYAVAKEFPKILREVESAERRNFFEMLSIVATPDDRGDPLFCIGDGDKLLKYIKILVLHPNKHGCEMLIEAVSNSYKKLDTVSRRTMIVKKRLESIK